MCLYIVSVPIIFKNTKYVPKTFTTTKNANGNRYVCLLLVFILLLKTQYLCLKAEFSRRYYAKNNKNTSNRYTYLSPLAVVNVSRQSNKGERGERISLHDMMFANMGFG